MQGKITGEESGHLVCWKCVLGGGGEVPRRCLMSFATRLAVARIDTECDKADDYERSEAVYQAHVHARLGRGDARLDGFISYHEGSERNSGLGMLEQTNLVELSTIHYTTRYSEII